MNDAGSGRDPVAPFRPGCGFLTQAEVEAWIDGRLPADRAAALAAHLEEGCDACAEIAADLAVFAEVVSREPSAVETRESDRQAEMLRARLRREVRARVARSEPTPLRIPWRWALAAAASVALAALLYVGLRAPAYPTVLLASGATVTIEPKPFQTPPALRGAADVVGLWAEASAAYRRDRFADAARTLATIEARAPDQVDAAIYRGVCLLMTGRTAEAEEALERARGIATRADFPTASIAWYQALAQLASGQESAARGLLEEAASQAGPYAAKARDLLERMPPS
jgi:tetratricopeptide (TPR) repeat protein